MIEETLRVVAVKGDYLWAEGRSSKGACSSCSTAGSCGVSLFGKLFGSRQHRLRLKNTVDAHTGEQVVIGVSDQVMVLASLMAYLLPVVMMAASAIAADLQGMSDKQQALVAGLGLLLGLFGAGVLTASPVMHGYFQPRLIRKADAPQLSVHPIEFKSFTGDTP